MNAKVDIAAVAALMADTTRAAFLSELLDGRALTAGELARRAGVSPSTASGHLTKLVEAGLLVVERAGRHRYFRLAGESVARALEALAVIAPRRPIRSLRESDIQRALQLARVCYNHLAGRLGVGLTEALVRARFLVPGERDYEVTDEGARWLRDFGIEVGSLRRQRRRLAAACLDWSERRRHLAGALGAALLQRLLALGWIQRWEGSRAVRITDPGWEGLRREFGLALDSREEG